MMADMRWPLCCGIRCLGYLRATKMSTMLNACGVIRRCPVAVGGGRRRLLNRNRVGRRKGILESFIERFFLVPALALVAIVIVLKMFAFRLGNHFPTPLKSYEMACLGMRPSRLWVNFEHPRNFELPHARSHPAATRREIKRLSIDLPEHDIERAYDRRDIGKHMTACQKVHRLQMGE